MVESNKVVKPLNECESLSDFISWRAQYRQGIPFDGQIAQVTKCAEDLRSAANAAKDEVNNEIKRIEQTG